MSTSRTARDRVRGELTREILVVAREHLAHEGAVALSLRAIARDLGMVPSALYRYFDGRDALLSALILEAYDSLADAVEEAAAGAARDPSDAARWLAGPTAMRGWALARPHEWALIFGSPVPGYHAPQETVAAYARVATALVRPVSDASKAGHLAPPSLPPAVAAREVAALDAALAPVHKVLLPQLPVVVTRLVLQAWAVLIGMISLEIFGHWRNTVEDPALLFAAAVQDAGRAIGLRG